MGETDLVELTLQVAKEVMGCRVVHSRDGTYKLVVPGSYDRIDFVTAEGAWAACPKYPTDWSAAGEVLEKLNLLYFSLARVVSGEGVRYDAICCDENDTEDRIWAAASTGPLAICLAALAAVRATK